MAGSSQNLDTLESLLSCTICLDHYDDTDHIPMMFGCQHMVCRACLANLLEIHFTQKTFPCPQCHDAIEIKPDGLEGYTKNRLLMEIFSEKFLSEKLQNENFNEKPNEMKCQVHPAKTVSHYCLTCREGLCSKCVVALSKGELHSGHEVQDIEDLHSITVKAKTLLERFVKDIIPRRKRVVVQ